MVQATGFYLRVQSYDYPQENIRPRAHLSSCPARKVFSHGIDSQEKLIIFNKF